MQVNQSKQHWRPITIKQAVTMTFVFLALSLMTEAGQADTTIKNETGCDIYVYVECINPYTGLFLPREKVSMPANCEPRSVTGTAVYGHASIGDTPTSCKPKGQNVDMSFRQCQTAECKPVYIVRCNANSVCEFVRTDTTN